MAFDVEIGVLRARDQKRRAGEVDIFIFNIGADQRAEFVNQFGGCSGLHTSMLANRSRRSIGPDVPSDGTFGYERSMCLAMKSALAGRAPRGGMEKGDHPRPDWTDIRLG